jgi:hypothetical protein
MKTQKTGTASFLAKGSCPLFIRGCTYLAAQTVA